ncbi:MAG: choice-of-anchor J domain-containing protein [Saprospiraceae bacterium]|nr:choice-of-anchor J domain-containing protein [Saprospiraceae bacterium]
MKRIIQLFILVFIAHSGFGQILFKQDFEGGTIDPMTMVDNDGQSPNINVGDYSAAWTVTAASQVGAMGSQVAVSNSWYSPPGIADDWLITPQLTIEDAKTALLWEAQAVDPNFADGYQVLVSTTDNELASFTDMVWSTTAEQAGDNLEQRILSLADYVGKDIYIAFRNNSADKFLLALDNIEVKVIQARDVTANGFIGARYYVKDVEIPVTLNITNNGGDVINSVDFTWSAGGNTYTDNITGLSLSTGESTDITHSVAFSATEAISYPLTMTLSNVNGEEDQFADDNEVMATVAGVSYVPNRKVVVEEGTGTWCGWCPRGAVGLDAAKVMFPDNFIGIAVHNGDPMAIAQYDGPLGITGFPGAKINRLVDADPGIETLEEVIPILRSIVSPMAPVVTALGDEDTRMINISTTTEFVTQLDGIDFRVAAVIIENNVTGTGNGYAQENYYSSQSQNIDLFDEINDINYRNLPATIPAADMVYQHVARDILGGFDGVEGSIPSNVVEGDMAEYNFTYEVPAAFDMKEMYVALLVIDNVTGEVLNGDEVKVSLITSTNEIDESISRIYPNPANGLTNIDINLQESADVTLEVLDMMGKRITKQNLGTLYGNNRMTYDVSEFNTGMYLFRVTAGDKVSTKKITVVN